MVTKERPPSLRGRNPPPHHIFGHAGLTDIDAKLEKLAMDPRCSPQRTGAAYLADKLGYFYRHGRSSAAVLRFPSPIRSKSPTVPTDYGLRSDDCKCATGGYLRAHPGQDCRLKAEGSLGRRSPAPRLLLNLLGTIAEKGAGFKSLRDTWADTTTAHGRLMLTFLGGLAEFERELIRTRTGE